MSERIYSKKLFQGYLPSSVASQYAAPSQYFTRIRTMSVVNTDTSVRTFVLYLSGTTAAAQITANAVSLAANGGKWLWSDGEMDLGPGDYIAGTGSVASKLVLTITGEEHGAMFQ